MNEIKQTGSETFAAMTKELAAAAGSASTGSSSQLARLQRDIQQLSMDEEQYRRTIRDMTLRREGLENELKTQRLVARMTGRKMQSVEDFERQLSVILEHPLVETIRWSEHPNTGRRALSIKTTFLNTPKLLDGTIRKLGEFRIWLSPGNTLCMIERVTPRDLVMKPDDPNLGGRYTHVHPHVDGTFRPCFGNIESEVGALLSNFQYDAAAVLLVDYLSGVNEDDSWGREVWRWQVAENSEVKEDKYPSDPTANCENCGEPLAFCVCCETCGGIRGDSCTCCPRCEMTNDNCECERCPIHDALLDDLYPGMQVCSDGECRLCPVDTEWHPATNPCEHLSRLDSLGRFHRDVSRYLAASDHRPTGTMMPCSYGNCRICYPGAGNYIQPGGEYVGGPEWVSRLLNHARRRVPNAVVPGDLADQIITYRAGIAEPPTDMAAGTAAAEPIGSDTSIGITFTSNTNG